MSTDPQDAAETSKAGALRMRRLARLTPLIPPYVPQLRSYDSNELATAFVLQSQVLAGHPKAVKADQADRQQLYTNPQAKSSTPPQRPHLRATLYLPLPLPPSRVLLLSNRTWARVKKYRYPQAESGSSCSTRPPRQHIRHPKAGRWPFTRALSSVHWRCRRTSSP